MHRSHPAPSCLRCRRSFRNEACFDVEGGYVHVECLTRDECEQRGLVVLPELPAHLQALVDADQEDD